MAAPPLAAGAQSALSTHDVVRAQAAALITSGAARLKRHGISWRLATSRRADTFTRTFDTLVVSVPRETPPLLVASHTSGSAKASVVAMDLRDVLTCWYAVGHGRYPFDKHMAFWTAALGLQLVDDLATMTMAGAGVAFPRVVVHWDPPGREFSRRMNPDSSMKRLKARVLDMFTRPPSKPTRRTNDDHDEDNDHAQRPHEPLQITLRVRFAPTAKATKALLDLLVVQARVASEMQRLHPGIAWTGVEILKRHCCEEFNVGIEVFHLNLLQSFMEELPASISVDMRLSSGSCAMRRYAKTRSKLVSRCLVQFLHSALGYSYGNTLGRLHVLDLKSTLSSTQKVEGAQTVFASLCTLLPFTSSLHELRVEIDSHTEMLWLAYAVFHPRTPQTPWRALTLDIGGRFRDTVDWRLWRKLLTSRPRLSTLKQLLAQAATLTPTQEIDADHAPVFPNWDGLEWGTAIVSKRARLYESIDQTAAMVSLPRGTLVEICDDVSTNEPREDALVAVVAAGVGLGYVWKSHLMSFTRKQFPSPPTSCIESLSVDQTPLCPEDQAMLLQLLGGSLLHFRTKHPTWLQSNHLRDWIPLIETIDCIEFVPAMANSDLSRLPLLRALGLRCAVDHVEQCAQWLQKPGHFRNLRDLRVYFAFDLSKPSDSHTAHFESLVYRKLSLRRLSHFVAHNEILPWTPTMDRRMYVPNDTARRKLALLSAVRHCQSQSQPALSAIANFDSGVLRTVFDMLGMSIEYTRYGVIALADFGATVMDKDELDTPSDAWYDDFLHAANLRR